MKKFNFLTTLFAVVAIFFALSITGCNKTTDPVSTTTGTDELTSMIVPDVQQDVSDIYDATVDNDMLLKPAIAENDLFFRPPTMGKDEMRKGYLNFQGICKNISLTDSQKVAYKALIKSYNECVRTAMQALRESEKTIIQAANIEIKAVRDSLKAGALTKKEARILIDSINTNTRTALKNNPERETYKTASCGCLTTLFTGIRAILTEEQIVKWDAWVAKLKHPCLTATN